MDSPGLDQLIGGILKVGEENSPTGLAALAKTRADTAETNSRSQLQDVQTQQDQVALDLARARSPLEKQAISRAALANVFSSYDQSDPDSADNIDKQLRDLDAAGITDARQYIGKVNRNNAERWADALGAGNPGEAFGAMNGESPLAGVGGARGRGAAGGGGAPGYSPEQIGYAISQMNPQQLQTAQQKVAGYRAALNAIDTSRTPAIEFARQAAALGHPEWADPAKFSPLALAPLRAEVSAWEQQLGGVGFGASIGAGAPTIPQEVKEAGGVLYGVSPTGRAATPLTPGPSTLVGVDTNTGFGVYHGPAGESIGTHALGAKPGTNRGGVFDAKRQAWLDVHPGDEEGALTYAGGRAGAAGGVKQMTPQQIIMAADTAAARDLNAMNNSGQPPADPAAFLAQRKAQYVADLTSAQIPGGPIQRGPGGVPAGRSSAPVPADAFTPARDKMAQAWQTATQRGVPTADIERRALFFPAMAAPAPPPQFTAMLHEGKLTVNAWGAGWTLRNGQPVRVF